MTTFYVNSKGQDVEIASMAYPHLCSAHAKLIRDQRDGLRQVEIDAMAAEIAARDEAHAAALAAQAEDAA
ncbi:hypothetical protein [Brevundimonas sp. CEF1]|uniref:hypothetical protein n=1 Tax=Brevundimonas sp. CEF1 TaxID=3442642 RepID=UPI003F51A0B7